jgi:hypothetical protein
MALLTALILIGFGALLGYGYFHLRKKPADNMADQDFVDCQAISHSKSEIAACYINKKTAKIKHELNID